MKRKFKVMLVEDDSNMAYMLRDNLEMAGYEVIAFRDGVADSRRHRRSGLSQCFLLAAQGRRVAAHPQGLLGERGRVV